MSGEWVILKIVPKVFRLKRLVGLCRNMKSIESFIYQNIKYERITKFDLPYELQGNLSEYRVIMWKVRHNDLQVRCIYLEKVDSRVVGLAGHFCRSHCWCFQISKPQPITHIILVPVFVLRAHIFKMTCRTFPKVTIIE